MNIGEFRTALADAADVYAEESLECTLEDFAEWLLVKLREGGEAHASS